MSPAAAVTVGAGRRRPQGERDAAIAVVIDRDRLYYCGFTVAREVLRRLTPRDSVMRDGAGPVIVVLGGELEVVS